MQEVEVKRELRSKTMKNFQILLRIGPQMAAAYQLSSFVFVFDRAKVN